mgnify:CR=1 FL=1
MLKKLTGIFLITTIFPSQRNYRTRVVYFKGERSFSALVVRRTNIDVPHIACRTLHVAHCMPHLKIA